MSAALTAPRASSSRGPAWPGCTPRSRCARAATTARLVLIGDERHKPYDRPPLSKDVLSGKHEDSWLEADWDALALDLRLDTTVQGIEGSTLQTDKGDVEFDRLVLATGS